MEAGALNAGMPFAIPLTQGTDGLPRGGRSVIGKSTGGRWRVTLSMVIIGVGVLLTPPVGAEGPGCSRDGAMRMEDFSP